MQVVVKGPAQTGFMRVIRFFDNEAAVKKACQEQSADLAAIAQGKIVVQTDKGPRAALTVMDLFALLGINNVAVTFCSGELEGAVVLAGRAPLITAP